MTSLLRTVKRVNLVLQEGILLIKQNEVRHTIRLLLLYLSLQHQTSNSSQISGLNPLLTLRLKWVQ